VHCDNDVDQSETVDNVQEYIDDDAPCAENALAVVVTPNTATDHERNSGPLGK